MSGTTLYLKETEELRQQHCTCNTISLVGSSHADGCGFRTVMAGIDAAMDEKMERIERRDRSAHHWNGGSHAYSI